MARVDVSTALNPAWKHMVRLLFKPFAMKKWLALGFASVFAGASGSSFNLRLPGGMGNDAPPSGQIPQYDTVMAWVQSHIGLLVAGAVALFAVSVFFYWLGSVFRFVYVNQVTEDPRAIRAPFARLKSLGTSFFLWQLCFGLIGTLIGGILIALPLFLVFSMSSNAAIVLKVLVVLWSVLVGTLLLFTMIFGTIFADDFVLPIMYVRNIRVLEAWKIALPMIRQNLGQMALYLVFLVVIGIGAAVVGFVAAIAGLLLFLIPGAVAGGLGYAIWQASGQAWSAGMITYAAVVGTLFAFALGYVMNCLVQPVAVFRRTFSLAVLGQMDESLATIPADDTPPPQQWSPEAPSY